MTNKQPSSGYLVAKLSARKSQDSKFVTELRGEGHHRLVLPPRRWTAKDDEEVKAMEHEDEEENRMFHRCPGQKQPTSSCGSNVDAVGNLSFELGKIYRDSICINVGEIVE